LSLSKKGAARITPAAPQSMFQKRQIRSAASVSDCVFQSPAAVVPVHIWRIFHVLIPPFCIRMPACIEPVIPRLIKRRLIVVRILAVVDRVVASVQRVTAIRPGIDHASIARNLCIRGSRRGIAARRNPTLHGPVGIQLGRQVRANLGIAVVRIENGVRAGVVAPPRGSSCGATAASLMLPSKAVRFNLRIHQETVKLKREWPQLAPAPHTLRSFLVPRNNFALPRVNTIANNQPPIHGNVPNG
jgi:hypothetical protein